MSSKSRTLVSWGDLALVLSLPFYFVVSWIIPERGWNGLCRIVQGISRAFSKTNPMVQAVSVLLPGTKIDVAADEIVRELEEGRREHYFQVFRDYAPGGWRPEFEITGLHHLEDARASGRGVILWMDHFVFNGLLPKKFLAQAGYPFSHLSRPEHGFSKTEFGVRVLNPLRSRIEDRYLNKRVLIERGAEARSVRTLSKLLKQGEIVSITAGAWEGRKTTTASVFGYEYPLATGAPGIAQSTGADLVPVAVYRLNDNGKFRIDLGDPIRFDREEPKPAAISRAMQEYAAHLEPVIRAFPGQWRGWKYLHKGE